MYCRCLTEKKFTCRSITFNAVKMSCLLTRHTMRNYGSYAAEEDKNADYFENECLTGKPILARRV